MANILGKENVFDSTMEIIQRDLEQLFEANKIVAGGKKDSF